MNNLQIPATKAIAVPTRQGRRNWNWQKNGNLKRPYLLPGCARNPPIMDPYRRNKALEIEENVVHIYLSNFTT